MSGPEVVVRPVKISASPMPDCAGATPERPSESRPPYVGPSAAKKTPAPAFAEMPKKQVPVVKMGIVISPYA